jgi:mono/diheme cytochrome c family protein
MTLMLAACGGGGSGGDILPSEPQVSSATGSDSFLLFPNPQVQPDGSFQTNSTTYTQAYYAAIDPTNAKDTLAKWKAANGFDSGVGTQVTAVFGDSRDLGYGRRMTARINPDGTIAFLVENYLANPGGAYALSQLSIDAAAVRDTRWLTLINAIEFSPGPAGGTSFAKFFNFDPSTEQRQSTVDIDGRGEKAMPGPCITCHGGRGDALTPDATGKLVFNIVQNSASGARGDVQAHLAPLEVDTFGFSTAAGFARQEQEATLKTMNELVLCTYPLSLSRPSGVSTNTCQRRNAVSSEWQGTAADLIINAYGGDGLPNPAFVDTFMPADWSSSGQKTLYQNVVVPSCRGCHTLRGTGAQSDIDLTTFDKFQRYAKFQGNDYPKIQGFDDRIKAHVIDRGDMPLAKIIYDAFWSATSPGPSAIAAFLEAQGFTVRDAAGVVLQPGRPVSDPGPDRVVGRTQGLTMLSAARSLFADAYSWSIVSGPDGATPPTGATLTNPNSVNPTFSAATDGKYVLQLVVSNGSRQSEPARLTLVVQSALLPAATAIGFVDIANVLQKAPCSGCVKCIDCHKPNVVPGPPVFFADASGALRADSAFYSEIRSRINFTDIAASPLLRKPSGNHHGGGQLGGFDASALPGDPVRANYDLFLNWILNGAPQ